MERTPDPAGFDEATLALIRGYLRGSDFDAETLASMDLPVLAGGVEFFRAILDFTHNGVIASDPLGNVLIVNRVAREWFGFGPEDPFPATAADAGYLRFHHADGVTPTADNERPAMRVLAGETLRAEHFTSVTPGQPPRHLSVTGGPLRGLNGRHLGGVLILVDVTDQYDVEAALRESEAKFSAAFHASPNALAIARLSDGCYLEVNDGFEKVIGYSREQAIGRTSTELGIWVNPEDRALLVDPMMHGEPMDDLDTVFRRSDGSVFVACITAQAITVGDEPCSLSVTRDITDEVYNLALLDQARDHLEEEVIARTAELELVNARLEEAAAARSRFFASMSHELRTPLNSVIGFSSVLLAGQPGPLTEEQQRQVEMILRAGQHQLTLVNEILDLERIDAGEQPFAIEQVTVAMLLEDTAALIEPLAREKELEFVVKDHIPGVTLVTDRGKVERILLNLLSNAVKFTESGSVRLEADRDGASILFRVTDTGVGISPEELPWVMDEFHQAQRAPATANQQGTGLGLAISTRLATALGGVLEAESELGQGSVFTLCLQTSATTMLRPR